MYRHIYIYEVLRSSLMIADSEGPDNRKRLLTVEL